jgi:hypothetical protein
MVLRAETHAPSAHAPRPLTPFARVPHRADFVTLPLQLQFSQQLCLRSEEIGYAPSHVNWANFRCASRVADVSRGTGLPRSTGRLVPHAYAARAYCRPNAEQGAEALMLSMLQKRWQAGIPGSNVTHVYTAQMNKGTEWVCHERSAAQNTTLELTLKWWLEHPSQAGTGSLV